MGEFDEFRLGFLGEGGGLFVIFGVFLVPQPEKMEGDFSESLEDEFRVGLEPDCAKSDAAAVV